MVVIRIWSRSGVGWGDVPITSADCTVATGPIPCRCMIHLSTHSDNLWTSFCAGTLSECWEKQGLCLQGDRHFTFTFSGRTQSIHKHTRWFQSTVSAIVLSVSRLMWSRVTQRRDNWSGRGHLSWILKHEKEPTSKEEEPSKQRNLQLPRTTVKERIGRRKKEPVGCCTMGVEGRARVLGDKAKRQKPNPASSYRPGEGFEFYVNLFLFVQQKYTAGVKTVSRQPASLIKNILGLPWWRSGWESAC